VKIWGWVARAAREGELSLKSNMGLKNEWITRRDHRINLTRADAVWETDWTRRKRLDSQANSDEALRSVEEWMELNEEPQKWGFQVLRAEKREALRTARSSWFKKIGGAKAIYATVALLKHSGRVVMESDRGSGGSRAGDNTWLRQAMKWLEAMDWIPEGTSNRMAEEAEAEQTRMRRRMDIREGTGQMKVMGVGEGWAR